MASCNQNDDNDDTHQQACTWGAQSTAVSWQHAPPLTSVSSLAGIKRMPGKLQVLLASLCHALIPFLMTTICQRVQQREAIIQTNYLLPLQKVTTYLNPLISYFPIYLSYHHAQDFKGITHLLNSYSYSYLRDIFPALLHPSTPPLWNTVCVIIKISYPSLFSGGSFPLSLHEIWLSPEDTASTATLKHVCLSVTDLGG